MKSLSFLLLYAIATGSLFAATEGIHYAATTDFASIDAGTVPYYVHKKEKTLAINAAKPEYRERFARANRVFDGEPGLYHLTLHALRETDGECTYRVLVDGCVVGSVVNAMTAVDYAPQDHVFLDIEIPAGATLAVESNSVTNGKIPEGDATAYARGRWTGLTLRPVRE